MIIFLDRMLNNFLLEILSVLKKFVSKLFCFDFLLIHWRSSQRIKKWNWAFILVDALFKFLLLLFFETTYVVCSFQNFLDDFERFGLQIHLFLLGDNKSRKFVSKITHVQNFFFNDINRLTLFLLVLSQASSVGFSVSLEWFQIFQ